MEMVNIIEKKIYTDGEPYYFNTETMEKYGEIVGGLAWPESKEGFLVIAAIDLFGNSQTDARPIRVLTKSIESAVDVLIKRALELQKHFSPFTQRIKFYGDTTSLEKMELLDQFNRDRRHQGLDPFYLTEAPKLKDTNKQEYYAHLMEKYTQPATKILHFCDTSLPRYLVSLFRDEISKRVLDHPPLAALGYALAVLDTWKPRKKEKQERFEIVFGTQRQGEREGNQDN